MTHFKTPDIWCCCLDVLLSPNSATGEARRRSARSALWNLTPGLDQMTGGFSIPDMKPDRVVVLRHTHTHTKHSLCAAIFLVKRQQWRNENVYSQHHVLIRAVLAFGTATAGSSQTSLSLFEDYEAMHHGFPAASGYSPERRRDREKVWEREIDSEVNGSPRIHTQPVELALSMCSPQHDGAPSLSVSQGGAQGELTALNTNPSICWWRGKKVPAQQTTRYQIRFRHLKAGAF